MLEEPQERSFADPETEFYLPSYPTSMPEAGHYRGEPTGEVVCIACWESHMNIDKIPHEPTCPQRFVRSRYWRVNHKEEADEPQRSS